MCEDRVRLGEAVARLARSRAERALAGPLDLGELALSAQAVEICVDEMLNE